MSGNPPGAGLGFPAGGVFNAAVDAVVVMGLDGRVADWNPAAEVMFGYSRDAALGKEVAQLIIPHALRDKHRAALTRFRDTGRGTILNRRLELFAMRGDGSMLGVELTVTRIPDTDPPLFAGWLRKRGGDEPPESAGRETPGR